MLQHTVERPDIGYTTAFPRGSGGRISVPVGRGIVLIVLLVSSVLFSDRPDALDRTRLIRIGVLTASWGPTPQVVGLQEGLRELGYREHVHFDVAVRFTQGDLTALPIAARDLLGYGVDLIIVDADQPAKAAQQATTQIPIVFVGVSDPVGIGLVQSFARPGGNITGVTDQELGLGPKRLEVFRDLIPRLKRVLYPYDVADAYASAGAKIYRAAAQRLGLERLACPVRTRRRTALRHCPGAGEKTVKGEFVGGPACLLPDRQARHRTRTVAARETGSSVCQRSDPPARARDRQAALVLRTAPKYGCTFHSFHKEAQT